MPATAEPTGTLAQTFKGEAGRGPAGASVPADSTPMLVLGLLILAVPAAGLVFGLVALSRWDTNRTKRAWAAAGAGLGLAMVPPVPKEQHQAPPPSDRDPHWAANARSSLEGHWRGRRVRLRWLAHSRRPMIVVDVQTTLPRFVLNGQVLASLARGVTGQGGAQFAVQSGDVAAAGALWEAAGGFSESNTEVAVRQGTLQVVHESLAPDVESLSRLLDHWTQAAATAETTLAARTALQRVVA